MAKERSPDLQVALDSLSRTPSWEKSTCDGCGEDIAPEYLEAATHTPPTYMPEDFRKRATVVLCELCRTEGDEQ